MATKQKSAICAVLTRQLMLAILLFALMGSFAAAEEDRLGLTHYYWRIYEKNNRLAIFCFSCFFKPFC